MRRTLSTYHRLGSLFAAWRARHVARRSMRVREILGNAKQHGGALVVERALVNGYSCDLCKRQRQISYTVLVPVVKGHSRPRFDAEAHPTFTVCWRCLIWRGLRLRVRRLAVPR